FEYVYRSDASTNSSIAPCRNQRHHAYPPFVLLPCSDPEHPNRRRQKNAGNDAASVLRHSITGFEYEVPQH
ncbi:hypothetical protein L0156_02355, partial [bacterium]|nr:hypothetical protein [bacterium]